MKYLLSVSFNDKSLEDIKKEFNTLKEIDNFMLPLLYDNQVMFYMVYVRA